MRAIKYAMFVSLLLAAYEATALTLLPSHLVRMGLAVVFLAYGVWALMLFRRASGQSVAKNSVPPSVSEITQTSVRTALLLLFRTAFIFCAFAYLALVVYIYDSSIVTPTSKHDFVSFLLAAFNQTFPPLTALCQYVFPELTPAVWNFGNKATLALRLGSYVLFVVVVASVLKEVWLLGYRSQWPELRQRVDIGSRRHA